MSRVRAGFAVVSLLVFMAPRFLDAQTAMRLGDEFQANTYTTGSQRSPSVALDVDGDFVVTWQSDAQDSSGYGLFTRRFSSTGVPQATEFQVNTYTTNYQKSPDVALDADGDFVIAWASFQDGGLYGIFARRFNSSGASQAVEFQVNSYTIGNQHEPSVAMVSGGAFVVVWYGGSDQDGSGYGIFGRRFNASGVPQAVEFLVNAYTSGYQKYPNVALDADGDFVVAWQSNGQDGAGYGVFARRFSSAGVPQASEFQATTYTLGSQRFPAVSVDADGDFVVAAQSNGQDGLYGVFARRFDNAGGPQATEFRVNATVTTSTQASVVSEADGDFLVTWSAVPGTILAQRFNSAGAALASEFRVNAYTAASGSSPTVAVDAAGKFVVAWQSYDRDGSEYGVFAQRFTTLAILDIDGNQATEPLTDGLLVLRFLFGFTGTTLTAGAVDVVNCTRCDIPTITAYLQTLI